MVKIEFKIEGMSCGGCARGTENAIKEVDGVVKVSVNFDNKTANVEFDEDKTCEQHVFKAVENRGYKIIES